MEAALSSETLETQTEFLSCLDQNNIGTSFIYNHLVYEWSIPV